MIELVALAKRSSPPKVANRYEQEKVRLAGYPLPRTAAGIGRQAVLSGQLHGRRSTGRETLHRVARGWPG